MNLSNWRRWTLTLTFVVLACSMTFAQGGGRGGGGRGGGQRGGPGGFGGFGGFGAIGGGSNDATLAIREEVQKELDLSEDQVEELRDLARNAPSIFRIARDEGLDMRSMFGMSQEEREEAMAPLAKKLAKAQKDASEDVLDVLKSKQKARFEELKFQYALSQGNFVGALGAADVDVDDDEKEELDELRGKVRAELDKRIAKLRMEVYAEALAKSDVISESKVEKLMGEIFAFSSTSSRGRGSFGGFGGGGRQGRGGPGGAGGDRGGRRRGGEDGGNRRRGGGDDEDGDANPRRRRPN